ncbi:MAG: hypothetical protein R3F46_00470 [bacterium]
MSRNSGVKLRSGIMETQSNKACRNCGVLMDDAGGNYVCLACGYRLEKEHKPSAAEASAWQKQVADLHSQKYLSAGQASSEQFMSGFGPLRVLLFLGIAALAIAAPLQNLLPLINGTPQGPLALPTALAALLMLAVSGWASFSQPGTQRLLQRNLLGLLALTALAGLVMSGPVSSMLAEQYGAMHNAVDSASGVVRNISQTPVWWQPTLLMGGFLAGLGLLAFICHREGTERMY